MDVRPATEDDLGIIGDIFVASCGDLIERFHPMDRGLLPLDPAHRLPLHEHLLRTGDVLIAEDDEPAGFSCSIRREDVWLLSQLWIDPAHQGKGVGKTLIDAALDLAGDASVRCVVSSLHPAARTLYVSRGMYPRCDIVELTGRGGGEEPIETRPLTEDDQAWIDDLDREVLGAAHPQDHAWFRGLGGGVALVRDGDAVGYLYASPSLWDPGTMYVGPGAVFAESDRPLLVRTALARVGDQDVTLRIASTDRAGLEQLISLGFRWADANLFLSSRPLGDPLRYLPAGGSLG